MLKKTFYPLLAFLVVALSSAAHAQVYTGHNTTPRLRGVNAAFGTTNAGYDHMATIGANVGRYQLLYVNTYPGAPATPPTLGGGSGDISSTDLASYHAWLSWEVTNSASDLNNFIAHCTKNNIKVLIDLHQLPGGSVDNGPFRMFLYNDCLTEFLNDWALIAQTYAGNPTIWGYDLCNEPNDAPTASYPTLVQNWDYESYLAAKQVRQYDNLDVNNIANGKDSQHAIIVEPASEGFAGLSIMPQSNIPGVVYSFHTYGDNPWYALQDEATIGTRVWPDPTPDGNIEDPLGTQYFDSYDWTRHDITDLYQREIAAARNFQLANNCKIFVGEFGTVRWSPGSAEYVSEMINYFESYGWDWTYTGFGSDEYVKDSWNGYDPELGLNWAENLQAGGSLPTVPKTDLKTVLTSWFANNVSPTGNFNFLNPSVGAGNISTNPNATPWSFLNFSGIVGNGSAFNNPDSITGTQCAYVQSKIWNSSPVIGTISQPVQWAPNTSYTVSVSAAYRANCPQQTVNVYVGGTIVNGVFSGGTLVGTITPLTTSWDTYTTPSFTVGQGSIPTTQLLTFVGGATTSDQTAFLDSVTVSKLAPSSLPLGSAWLMGANINDGSGSSGGPTETALAASDGNTASYYSSNLATGGWTGIDLGTGKTATLTHVYFYPRSDAGAAVDHANADGYGLAMNGGVFQGTNDTTLKSWTTLATINNYAPRWGQVMGARLGCWCQLPVTGAIPYRYFRYLGPANSNCNVAEIRYYGNPGAFVSDGTSASSANPPQAAFDGNYLTTAFESTKTSGPGWTGIDLGAGNTAAVDQISFYPDGTPSKMVGGVFQGTNDTTLTTWTNLAPAIASAPAASTWTTLTMPTPNPNPPVVAYPNAYRYFRYYNSTAQNSGVAEIQFYGSQSHVLTGTNINDAWGTTWGNPPTNAYDGNTSTCYDSNLPTGGWTGIDVGAANPAVVTCIRYYPNSGWGGGPSQMIGGVFQGSNDETHWTNLTSQITTAPKISAWTSVTVNGAVPYRYLRYYDNGNNNYYCNVAEVQFIGY